MTSDLQPPHLLDPRRWTKALLALIVIYLAIFVYKLLQNYAVVPSEGQTDGYDFMALWSAAVMALEGRAALAYDFESIQPIQQAIFPLDVGTYPWHYPPSFQLLLMPLGTLPYLLAYTLWTLASLALFCTVMWRFVPHPAALLVLLAAPLSDRVFATGQTSFLTAALLGLFALDLERRPGRAGLWLGLLTLKPQLGVLVPIALAIGHRWRTFLTAALTAVGLGLATLAVFGFEGWTAFFENLGWASRAIADADNVLAVIASLFSSMHLIGVGLEASYALHLSLAAMTALLVFWVWWQPFALDLKVACLIAGAALISPFHHDYDLMILSVPFAILVRSALREGWLRGEPATLFFVWLYPGLSTILAVNTGIQTGFIVPLVMLGLCLRRTLRSRSAPTARLSPSTGSP